MPRCRWSGRGVSGRSTSVSRGCAGGCTRTRSSSRSSAGVVLVTVAATIGGGVVPAISCAIYSLTVCGLFGTSALYHRRVWSPRGYAIVRRLDHSMIFVFIAGTYTPFSVLLLPHTTAIVILSVVWGGAVLGVAMNLIGRTRRGGCPRRYTSRSAGSPSSCCRRSAREGGVTALALLLAGGVLYTVGAVVLRHAMAESVAEHVRPPRVLPRVHAACRALPVRRDLLRALSLRAAHEHAGIPTMQEASTAVDQGAPRLSWSTGSCGLSNYRPHGYMKVGPTVSDRRSPLHWCAEASHLCSRMMSVVIKDECRLRSGPHRTPRRPRLVTSAPRRTPCTALSRVRSAPR